MTLSKGDSDIPASGRLLLIDEESSVEPGIHDLGDVHLSGTIKPVLQTCECKICARSPALIESQTPTQGAVGGHQVGSAFW